MQSMTGWGVGWGGVVSVAETLVLFLILPLLKHVWDSGAVRLCQEAKILRDEPREWGLYDLRSDPHRAEPHEDVQQAAV